MGSKVSKSSSPKDSPDKNLSIIKPMSQRYAGSLQRAPKFAVTAEQIKLLQKSLPTDLDGTYELGKSIFATVFQLTPDARPIFTRAFHADTLEADNLALNKFYLRFVQAIFASVQNLANVESVLEPKMYQIGKQHGQLLKCGFSPELFDYFPVAIKTAITARLDQDREFPKEQLQDVVIAWELLANHMVAILKLGLCSA